MRTRSLRKRMRSRERGSYLVLAAFVVLMMMIASALGVDVSRKYRLEQVAQDVADAAALAAANYLPDEPAARAAAVRYIDQHTHGDYTASMNQSADIQIAVSADNRSGTVGVILYGSWDAMFMPLWLTSTATGEKEYMVSRYAIANMKRTVTQDSYFAPGTVNQAPGGPFALYLGDSDATTTSDWEGNNGWIVGSAHVNHPMDFTGSMGSELDSGDFESPFAITGTLTGAMTIPAPYVPPPAIYQDSLIADVRLDTNLPNAQAYYADGVVMPMIRPGPDGVYGDDSTTAMVNEAMDDIPIRMDDGSIVTAMYTAITGLWTVGTGNSNVTSAMNNGIGTGVDLYVNGDLSIGMPNSAGGGAQCYWKGSMRVSGKMTVTSNNSELRCVLDSEDVYGLDNAGLGVHTGWELPDGAVGLDNGGNMFNIYGLAQVEAAVLWTGNMSNPSSSDPGTTGNFDSVGNGFIKGALVAEDMDDANGGGVVSPGNNLKIYYDGTMTGGVPILNAAFNTPPRWGTPVVALIR